MMPLNHGENEVNVEEAKNGLAGKSVRVRLAGELSNNQSRVGESVKVHEIAAKYHLPEEAVLKIFAEFERLGMVTLSENGAAGFRPPPPLQMPGTYGITARLARMS